MWQSDKTVIGRRRCCAATAMAHRRGLVSGRPVRFGLVGLALTVVVAGTVFISGEVTGLRARVAVLEDRRACLAAAEADLEARWVAATAPAVVAARAGRELGLVTPDQPDFVLVETPVPAQRERGLIRRVLANLGGGDDARAAVPPRMVMGSMVSLTPREEPATRTGAGP